MIVFRHPYFLLLLLLVPALVWLRYARRRQAPLTFSDGSLVIQDILDSMMPNMIPLALTGLMYWLIKKGVNTLALLAIAIVGGIALSALGILV